jgi:hypothetical protein
VVDREEVFRVVFFVAQELGLVETGEERVLRLTRRGRRWENVPLANKVRRIWEVVLAERSPDHDDFHERTLRRLMAKRLAVLEPGQWTRLRDLPFRARNEYLATLEENGIRSSYRNRYRRSFTPPTEDPHELAEDLVAWTCRRLFLLGIVDLAMEGDAPVSLRLTEQGHRLLQGKGRGRGANGDHGDDVDAEDAAAARAKPLVVNPDFEVLLLPEGDINEMAHTLDRFARRVRSDAVSRFRLEREGVERAVVQGMTVDAILEFLAERSRAPVPQNVTFSIREWGGRVRFARQRQVTLLEVDRADALDRALELDAVKAVLLDRLSPTAAALRGPVKDHRALESLRALGVYLR